MKLLLTNFKVKPKSTVQEIHSIKKERNVSSILKSKKAKKWDNKLVMTDQNPPKKILFF